VSSIFISYASEDRERAKALALALEQHGLSVWWDRKIPLGTAFDEVIEQHLSAARCVLVLWTRSSIESRWVRAEASEAAARDVLIPLLLEPGVKIPLEFKLLQAADLSNWHGEVEQPEFRAVLQHVTEILRQHTKHDARSASDAPHATGTQQGDTLARSFPAARTAAHSSVKGSSRNRKLRDLAMFIVLPSLLVAAAAAAAISWRVPSPTRLEVLTDRISFSVAGEHNAQVPPAPLSFTLLSIENFDALTFTPRRESLVSARERSGAARARTGQITVQGEADRDPLMILEPVAAPDGAIGRLQSLTVTPGSRVIAETKEGSAGRLTLKVEGQPLDAAILPAGEVRLTVSDASIEGRSSRSDAGEPQTLRLALAPDHPIIQLQGGRRSFAITAGIERSEALTLLASAQVQAVHFRKQGVNGQLESAILGKGTVTYPEQPEAALQALERGDFLELGEEDPWLIEQLQLRPDGAGLEVRLVGKPREMILVSGGLTRDLRLTFLETVWNNAQVAVLVSIAIWATSISAGAYRLYREFVTGKE
jgi:hypothetical protein